MMIEQNRRCAISYLNELKASTSGYSVEWLDMAIKALEQQPSEDCISREAVLDEKWTHTHPDGFAEEYVTVKDILELPSVTPKVETKYKWEQTDKIEESNYSTEQYEADLKCAYDCGYSCGYNDAMIDIAEGSESE